MADAKKDVAIRVSPAAAELLAEFRGLTAKHHNTTINNRAALELAIRLAHHTVTVGYPAPSHYTPPRKRRYYPGDEWVADAQRPVGRPKKDGSAPQPSAAGEPSPAGPPEVSAIQPCDVVVTLHKGDRKIDVRKAPHTYSARRGEWLHPLTPALATAALAKLREAPAPQAAQVGSAHFAAVAHAASSTARRASSKHLCRVTRVTAPSVATAFHPPPSG